MMSAPRGRSLRLALSAAGFIATSTSGASPGVRMSWSAKWTWKLDTPGSVPAGARISAGKFGSVDRSLPKAAVSWVKRSPASCMPSPESPAKRMMTRSSCWTCLVTVGGPPRRAAAGHRPKAWVRERRTRVSVELGARVRTTCMLPAPQCHRSCHSRFRVGRDASHSVVTDPHSSPVPPDAAGGARYEPVTPWREVVHSSVIYVLADGQVHTGCVPARELPERVPRIFSLLHRCLPHSRRRAPRGVVVVANSSAHAYPLLSGYRRSARPGRAQPGRSVVGHPVSMAFAGAVGRPEQPDKHELRYWLLLRLAIHPSGRPLATAKIHETRPCSVLRRPLSPGRVALRLRWVRGCRGPSRAAHGKRP